MLSAEEPRTSWRLVWRVLPALVGRELRATARRMVGRDPGPSLARTPAVTRERVAIRDQATRALLGRDGWAAAVAEMRGSGHRSAQLRAAAAMYPEDFGDFVVFAVRTVNELLAQAATGRVTDRADLARGLVWETRLNGASDAAVFAEAAGLVPALAAHQPDPPGPGDRAAPDAAALDAARRVVEPLLAPYARRHGPIPARLLDVSARHLATGA